MTTHGHEQAEPGSSRQNVTPLVPNPRPPEQDLHEVRDPYDLPFPDRSPAGRRPEYVIVVDQLRDRQPGQPPSLAELLKPTAARTRESESDLEAEP